MQDDDRRKKTSNIDLGRSSSLPMDSTLLARPTELGQWRVEKEERKKKKKKKIESRTGR